MSKVLRGYKECLCRLYWLGLIVCSLSLNAFALTPEYVPGELIVKTKTKIARQAQRGFLGKMASRGLTFKGSLGLSQIHQLKLSSGRDLDDVLSDLSKDPDIEYAEPNYIIRKTEDLSTTVTPLSYQQMMSAVSSYSNGSYSQSGSRVVSVNEAWSEVTPTTDSTPIVAVLDTGIDYNHTIIRESEALWVNEGEIPNNGIDDDGDGYVDDVIGWNFKNNRNTPRDDDGHGTHVSGIVIGLGIDIFEHPLRKSLFKIMPLKFLGADGSGDTANAVRAIDYAIRKGAKVINASWGGPSYSRSLHEAFSRAYAAGLFISTAAGNSTSDNDKVPIYPATLEIPSLIAVAASNNSDRLASFSNYGAHSVHIAAPGVSISSTIPGDNFCYLNGTSMAAPFVAGVAALMLREAPQLTGFQLRELIINSAKSSENFTQKIYTSGQVYVPGALRSAKSLAGGLSYQPNYIFSIPDRVPASEATPASGNSNKGGGCGTVGSLSPLAMGPDDDGSFPGPSQVSVLILLMLPLVFWILLRQGASTTMRASTNSLFDARFSGRIEVSDVLMVKSRSGMFEANLKNISKGGLAFTFSGKSISKDEQVTFIFSSKDGNEKIEVAGRIVWTDAQRIAGVQFHFLSDYMQKFLLRSYA